MNVRTEDDAVGAIADHPLSHYFTVIGYASGGFTLIPHHFFRKWVDEEPNFGTIFIGRCSAFGVGSFVKYDGPNAQSLRVGRFVSGGCRLQFLLNGQHETRTISTYMFAIAEMGLRNAPPPQYGDSIIKNDVWIGDEAMMLGGGVIENGCIIGAGSRLSPNFRSEPYGIYAGFPARLVGFRFPERVREALLDLAWWEMPLTWIRENNDSFLEDLTADESKSLEVLAALKERKAAASVANRLDALLK
jgi:acetyltransferase-like isoleucine patch superfamily enzyme